MVAYPQMAQAAAEAPLSRRQYVGLLWFHLALMAVLVVFGIYFPTPISWIFLLICIPSLGSAFQSAERIFLPLQAARRSAGFSPETRSRLLRASRVLGWIISSAGIALIGIGCLHRHLHYASAGSLVILSRAHLALFIQDLLGVKLAEETEDYVHSPPIQDPQPLQSAHWGESSQSRSTS
jgi:hypothetical protein